MGYYIQTTKNRNKADALIQEVPGTELIVGDLPEWEDLPPGLAAICVVVNGTWEAAALAFCKEEYDHFKIPDGRPRKWLLMPMDTAHKLAGYEEES